MKKSLDYKGWPFASFEFESSIHDKAPYFALMEEIRVGIKLSSLLFESRLPRVLLQLCTGLSAKTREGFFVFFFLPPLLLLFLSFNTLPQLHQKD